MIRDNEPASFKFSAPSTKKVPITTLRLPCPPYDVCNQGSANTAA